MPAQAPEQLVEHFFRHQSARLIASLVRRFGFAQIDVIEEMVQEAVLTALRTWRLKGIPQNPSAWLSRTARNRLIDALRHSARQRNCDPNDELSQPGQVTEEWEPDEIGDSRLRMIFACCHPSLDRRAQLALTLRMVCGFSDTEVARCLLIRVEAAKKRVTRAKQRLRQQQIIPDLPSQAVLAERTDAVHDVLYLMFNEGYSTTTGPEPLREELCEEAARLCHLLCEREIGTNTTKALLALMLFHAARFESRVHQDGHAVLLEQQDRSLWDRKMIRVAEYWLAQSVSGNRVTRFHLEAGIARIHSVAESPDETDWVGIIRHYDLLLQIAPSPVCRLNRAIAVARVGRIEEALQTLTELRDARELRDYPLLHCAIADVCRLQGRTEDALAELHAALELTLSQSDEQLIRRRIARLQSGS